MRPKGSLTKIKKVKEEWSNDSEEFRGIVCPDTRTSMVMKVEAFDISEKGYDTQWFRRQMAILSKVLKKPGIKIDTIINEFPKKQREEINPPLSTIMIQCLAEELNLVGHLEIQDGKASITEKGRKRLDDFKANLEEEVREAIGLL